MQIFPHVVFFCYLAREIFLPREGNHFCYFCIFDHSSKLKLKFHYTFLTFLGSTILKPYLRKLLRDNLRNSCYHGALHLQISDKISIFACPFLYISLWKIGFMFKYKSAITFVYE